MPGVGLVGIGGQQNPAIRVQVNPAQLAADGLDLEAVRTALATATVDQPKGTLYGANQAFALQTNDQLMTAQGFNDYILANRPAASRRRRKGSTTSPAPAPHVRLSGPVRVRDVGRAIVGPQDVNLAGWMNTEPAIIIAVQRQSGANVIATVDQIKKALPRLEASLPPSLKIHIVSDRTQTIRASVADVQHTLLLTIVLVVGVILLFLRKLWATVIPAISVPMSLIGTFAVTLCARLQPRQSVADGADDRGRLCRRRCDRHDREHRAPHRGGKDPDGGRSARGRRNRFYDHVDLDLADRGVHPAVSDERHCRSVVPRVRRHCRGGDRDLGDRLADLDADDVRPRPDGGGRGAFGPVSRALERFFDALAAAYDRGLVVALRHRFVTLMVMISTVVLTGVLFVEIPKGFFPQEDTGLIQGIAEGAQNISPQAMKDRMRAVLAVVMKDPAVAAANAYIGPGGPTVTENDGRVFITLKPLGQRTASVDQVIARLNKALQPVWGITLYMQAAQDITVGARVSKTQYQYTLVDVDSDELDHWAPILLKKLQTLPQLTDVASDQQSTGRVLKIEINRQLAQQFGINPSVGRFDPL